MEPRRKQELGAGIVVLLLVAWHAYGKVQLGILPEMLWACHVAAVLLALGLLAGNVRAVEIGFLFFVSVGLPAWMLDVLAGSETTLSSSLIHTVTPLAGALVVRERGLRLRHIPEAMAIYYLCLVASYLWTPPELNINVAHRPWGPMAPYFSQLWAYHLCNVLWMVLCVGGGYLLITRVLRWPAPTREA